MKATIRQGVCDLSFDQAKGQNHLYWYCDYTYGGLVHNDHLFANPYCCYPINVYLVSDDPIGPYDTVLLTNGRTLQMDQSLFAKYLDSAFDGRKKVLGLASISIMREIALDNLKIGDVIDINDEFILFC